MRSNDKIAAIYNLRSAVEAKVHAEQRLADVPSPGARAALLDAALELEEKTQRAIEVCHECGLEHAPGKAHSNVIEVDFHAGKKDADA
jgi:hypothetical protein